MSLDLLYLIDNNAIYHRTHTGGKPEQAPGTYAPGSVRSIRYERSLRRPVNRPQLVLKVTMLAIHSPLAVPLAA